MTHNLENTARPVRPHHLLCLFCALEKPEQVPEGRWVAELAATIRRDPGIPLALYCRSDDSFAFQSPSDDGVDAPDACFTQKQDMEILFRMNLPPGTVLPARIAVASACKAVTSVWWDPCPCGGYEKGRSELMAEMGHAV